MGTTSSDSQLTTPYRVVKRLLDPYAKLDYLWTFLFAAWPILCAWLVGAHYDIGEFAGYWCRPNWWSYAITLPAALLLLRWAMNKIAPLQDSQVGDDPASIPPIIQLVGSPQGQQQAYRALRRTLLSGANIGVVLAIVVLFHVFDMREVFSVYLSGSADGAQELDWSIVFAGSDVPRWQNLALVVSAYAVQAATLTILFLFAILLARHNLFFLDRVYQRRRVPDAEAEAYITIDLDDVDQCFGFRQANRAFNVQLLLLALIGFTLLVSRFVNVGTKGPLFTDFGQVAMVVGWFVGLALITLPMWVKILPFGDPKARRSIVNYLREFLPEKKWPYGDSPDAEVIKTLAARFSINAFWPTGNNRATSLFLLAFLAMCYLVVPNLGILLDRLGLTEGLAQKLWIIPLSAIPYLAVASALTAIVLWAFRVTLRYVDPRLVDPPNGDTRTLSEMNEALGIEPEKSEHRLFISYRREDSAAYAGRLQENLEKHFYAENVFFDLADIGFGSDFVDVIEEKIASSDVMLVIIGQRWLSAADDDGKPRLGSENDYVTVEIATALERGLEIIPLLVGGARMPGPQDLPDSISALSRKNAAEISDSRWSYDVQKVIDVILAREPKPRER